MKKYIYKFIKLLVSEFKKVVIWLLISLFFLSRIFRDWIIQILFEKFGYTPELLISTLLKYPLLMPCLVITLYFIWVFYKVLTEANWDYLTINNLNTDDSSYSYARLIIINNNDEEITDCKVELVNFKFIKNYEDEIAHIFYDQNFLPVQLAWFINGRDTYENIVISRNEEVQLSIAYSDKINKNKMARFAIKIPEIILPPFHPGLYRIKICIFGKYKNKSIAPKIIYKIIEFNQGKLFIIDD